MTNHAAERRPAPGPRAWLASPWPAPVLALLCFANTLSNDFVYDDQYIVVHNPRITTLAKPADIWLSDWWYPLQGGSESDPLRDRLYRPLTLFSFALDYAADRLVGGPGGPRPFGFHLTNILLHALASLLVWHLAYRLAGNRAVAALAAAVFAVHPVHVEAVAGIVGRAELLAAVFLLLGLLALLPARRTPGPRRLLAAAGAFLCALLAKEHAVCYPLLALLALRGTHQHRPLTVRQWFVAGLILLLPLAAYFPLRYMALEGHLLRPAPTDWLLNPLVGTPPAQRVSGALTVLGHYTRLLILPAHLSSDYGLAVINPRAGWTVMTVLGLLSGLAAVSGLCGFRFHSPNWQLIATLTAMSLASYALISNTFMLIGVAVAERLAYWLSVPTMLLVALGIVNGWQRLLGPGRPLQFRRRTVGPLGFVLLGSLALRTVTRNNDWRDNLTLAARDVGRYPQSAQLHKGYAHALMWEAEKVPDVRTQTAMLQLAEEHLTQALQIYPLFSHALSLRARIRAHFGRTAEARADAQAALFLEPNEGAALYVLSMLDEDRAKLDQVIAERRSIVAQRPDDPAARVALGAALLEAGQPSAAREHLERAYALTPADPQVWQLLAEALAATGQHERAIALYQRVIGADPADATAYANLAWLLSRRNVSAAVEYARRAWDLAPDDARIGMVLGEVLAQAGAQQAALEHYRQLLRRLDPNHPLYKIIAARKDKLTAGTR